jgi:hypothetical protein
MIMPACEVSMTGGSAWLVDSATCPGGLDFVGAKLLERNAHGGPIVRRLDRREETPPYVVRHEDLVPQTGDQGLGDNRRNRRYEVNPIGGELGREDWEIVLNVRFMPWLRPVPTVSAGSSGMVWRKTI